MVHNAVAANGETHSFLDRFVWSVLGTESGIGGCFVGWDLGVVDEEECVGAAIGVGVVALGTFSEFVAEACFPLGTL